jgi:hypothetical protein
MAESSDHETVASLIGPFTSDELLAAFERHPTLSYNGPQPPTFGSTFDAVLIRNEDQGAYPLIYMRQDDGRWQLTRSMPGPSNE